VAKSIVAQYFGVRSLRDFDVRVDLSELLLHKVNTEFNRLFERLKPYLLAYRLNSPNLRKRLTEGSGKQNEARLIRQCRIEIVDRCFFSFATDGETEIDPKEFINRQDTFYYRQAEPATLESLKKDSIFCDAFAEMMCIIFKVNDLKNDFRQILKNDIADTNHLALQDIGREKIDEAYRLLGVPRYEVEFWRNIFHRKGQRLSEPVENTEALRIQALQKINYELPSSYELADLENFANKEAVELLVSVKNSLGLALEEFAPAGLYLWHKDQMYKAIRDAEYQFKQSLWLKLNHLAIEQSGFIKRLNNYNRDFIGVIDPVLTRLKYQIEVPYAPLLQELVEQHYRINLGELPVAEPDIHLHYEILLAAYGIDETDIDDEAIRSLLFFTGNTEELTAYLNEHFEQKEEEQETGQNDEPSRTGNIVEGALTKGQVVISSDTTGNNGGWLHSGRKDAAKKRSGRRAEQLVYQTFIERYSKECVRWVSGYSTTPDKNDRLHYDMEYKNEEGDWKYLEVKSLSDDQFIISSAELTMGLAHPDRYELALVSEDTIYVIKDIFRFKEGESLEINDRFMISPKDYIFAMHVGVTAQVTAPQPVI
jgi:hypothetical protein